MKVIVCELPFCVVVMFRMLEPQNWFDFTCIVMQEASDAHSKTADSDTVSTYQAFSVPLVTDKKLEAFNKA